MKVQNEMKRVSGRETGMSSRRVIEVSFASFVRAIFEHGNPRTATFDRSEGVKQRPAQLFELVGCSTLSVLALSVQGEMS